MIFKRLEKQLDELQKQPNELGKQLDELLESLSKNSTVVDNLAQDKLKKAHIIMGYALATSRSAVMHGLNLYSAEWYVAQELFNQLETAEELVGEVIGKGGAGDE